MKHIAPWPGSLFTPYMAKDVLCKRAKEGRPLMFHFNAGRTVVFGRESAAELYHRALAASRYYTFHAGKPSRSRLVRARGRRQRRHS